jgi:hypothetical protein
MIPSLHPFNLIRQNRLPGEDSKEKVPKNEARPHAKKFLNHAGTDSVPRSRPTHRHLQEYDSCLLFYPEYVWGGRLRNGKDVGSGEEAGFSPTKLFGASKAQKKTKLSLQSCCSTT